METKLLALILSVAVATVSTVYVYDRDTNTAELHHDTLTCPEGCKCSQKEGTAQCSLSYSSYSVTHLFPWQLTRLHIHGDASAWNGDSSKLSVREVIYGDRDIHQQKDAEVIEAIFSKLTYLDISYVPIKQIAELDFTRLDSLEFLTLTNDNISHIETKAFEQLSNLETLNLSNNQISSLSDDIFMKLTKLKNLNLRSNKLNQITESVFSSLGGLELLDLQNNHIQHLTTFIYAFNSLKMLDIRENKITYVPEVDVSRLLNFEKVLLAKNPFWCSCKLKGLIEAYRQVSTHFDDQVECSAPKHLAHMKFEDLDIATLPCNSANVTAVTLSSNVLYQGSMGLDCEVTGDLPLAVYWLTPWGDTFSNRESLLSFPSEFLSMKIDETYSAMNLLVTSRVYVSSNWSLHIDKYRGHFSGEFTCVAVNVIGQSNKTISVGIETKLPFIYITSLIVGAFSGGSMLVLAVIVGLVRMFVNKCLHSDTCNCCCCRCDDVQIIDEKIKPEDLQLEIEVKTSSSIGSLDYTDYDPSLPPPDPPFNSPQLRLSPEKCYTPDGEDTEEETKVSPPIWDQLEEVRSRLRYGAERRMEKVRSHVRSITDTGSLKIRNIKDAGSMKIQSIKETGSHAASKVRKNVASGMVQVKYGVQSIKEFCGTGDMGPGTISMVSVSTDVDTKECTQIVRSHTFV